jgi:hypothetical protein
MKNKETTTKIGNVTIHHNQYVMHSFEVNGVMFKRGEVVDIINPKTGLKSVNAEIDFISEGHSSRPNGYFTARVLGPFGSGSPAYNFDQVAKYGTTQDDRADWKTPMRSCPMGLI